LNKIIHDDKYHDKYYDDVHCHMYYIYLYI
jgi:hypothetical protein